MLVIPAQLGSTHSQVVRVLGTRHFTMCRNHAKKSVVYVKAAQEEVLSILNFTGSSAGDYKQTRQHPFPGGPSPWSSPLYYGPAPFPYYGPYGYGYPFTNGYPRANPDDYSYGSNAGDPEPTGQHPFPGGPSPWSSPFYYGPAPYPYYGTDGYGYPFSNEYQRANPDYYSYGGSGGNEDSKKN
ncbi:hypothetical protein V5799_028898 [Amblyomma americanum]|uniref:Uncharacterized protein n=1 Tax=Amblyomma americanum TaxID=6943 RepID=A0AAQ4DBJ6_AMBAM